MATILAGALIGIAALVIFGAEAFGPAFDGGEIHLLPMIGFTITACIMFSILLAFSGEKPIKSILRFAAAVLTWFGLGTLPYLAFQPVFSGGQVQVLPLIGFIVLCAAILIIKSQPEEPNTVNAAAQDKPTEPNPEIPSGSQ